MPGNSQNPETSPVEPGNTNAHRHHGSGLGSQNSRSQSHSRESLFDGPLFLGFVKASFGPYEQQESSGMLVFERF
jgi:hypothetical protein